MRPGQEGMLELNLARALAATNKLEEAQAYYDKAVAAAHDGLPLRAALFHRTMNLLSLQRLEEAVARPNASVSCARQRTCPTT